MANLTKMDRETVCLEKLIVVQLDKKFPSHYGTRMLIAFYTSPPVDLILSRLNRVRTHTPCILYSQDIISSFLLPLPVQAYIYLQIYWQKCKSVSNSSYPVLLIQWLIIFGGKWKLWRCVRSVFHLFLSLRSRGTTYISGACSSQMYEHHILEWFCPIVMVHLRKEKKKGKLEWVFGCNSINKCGDKCGLSTCTRKIRTATEIFSALSLSCRVLFSVTRGIWISSPSVLRLRM